LVITAGQQDRRHALAEPFLVSRAVEAVKPYVKWAYEPLCSEDVPAAIARGYYLAMQPPKGPVFLSIPMDDWSHDCAAVSARDLVDPIAVHLIRGELQLQTLAHHSGEKTAHRMLLPSGRFHDGGNRCACRRLQHRDDARLLRASIGLVGLGPVSRL